MNGKINRIGHTFYHSFAVPSVVNKSEFKLERDSPISGETVTGIQIRRVSAGAKSVNGNNLVNANVFASSHITLQQRTAEVASKIPLEAIALATDNGLWYDVNLPLVDMAQSFVRTSNLAAIVAGEDYEFIFRYTPVAKN